MISRSFDFDIVTDSEVFRGLRQDWNDLYSRADSPYFSQSFDWNWCSWQTSAIRGKWRLHCLVARAEGRVILIWPVAMKKYAHLWSLAEPLASGTEYTKCLVDATLECEEVINSALQTLRDTCGSDIFRFNHVRADTPLFQVLIREKAVNTAKDPAPSAVFDEYPSWESYYRSLSGSFRSGLNRKRRRLAENGEIIFDSITEIDEYRRILAWMLDQKRRWMHKRGFDAPHMRSDAYEEFFRSIVGRNGECGQVMIFALKLHDRVIAAELSSIDDKRVEWVLGAFDFEFSQYSPGRILKELCLKWAFDHGLSYDFRVGEEAHKRTWANRTCDTRSFKLANSGWGATHLKLRELAVTGKQAAEKWRKRIRRVRSAAKAEDKAVHGEAGESDSEAVASRKKPTN